MFSKGQVVRHTASGRHLLVSGFSFTGHLALLLHVPTGDVFFARRDKKKAVTLIGNNYKVKE